jgi:cytochrome c553
MIAIAKSHHGDDSTIDGLTVATSYRLLYGIVGLEDSDWEYRPTASAHNQYKGVDRAADTTSGATNTISYLCAECHGMFHSGVLPEGVDNDTTFASPWFRHPVDFDMYNVRTKSDYQGYGGVGVNNYEVTAPVASSDVSSLISTGVYSASGKAIVTCISCHRAHGTPNDAILRWNYKAWPGGGYAGCQVCHTIKD